jgi:hypothetical protein
VEPSGAAEEPPIDPAPPPPAKRRDPLLLLFGLVLVVLVGGVVFLWQHPLLLTRAAPPASVAPPPDPRLDAALARLDALSQRVAALDQHQSPNLQPLEARITALEQRRPPDLAPLTARITALEQRPDPLAAKLDALSARLDADEAKMANTVQDASQVSAAIAQSARAARVSAALVALINGRPLGALPGAPPALARFAQQPPPTEAALRQAFPAAAAKALAAHEDTGKLPFWQAISDQVQSVITVRRGDEVLVGDSAAGIIGRARADVEVGDIDGAVKALGELTGPPSAAFADWLGQAKSLLEARSALQSMAAGS